MSAQSRTVSNGRAFPASVRKAVLNARTICVCCKTEPATELDHIQALDLGGSSVEDNAMPLCGRCHWEKNIAEQHLEGIADARKHIAKFLAMAFTPKGKRRVVKLDRDSDAARKARLIDRAKRRARLAKARGQDAVAEHQHKIAAAHRRAK
jgi:hypothetical protein